MGDENTSTGKNWRTAYVDAGRNSNGSVDRTAQRVRTPTSYVKVAVAAESVTFAAGVAGTTGVLSFANTAIYDSKGADLGRVGDTSFSWITGTILTTEVVWRSDQTDTVQLAALAQGEYAINYDTGKLRYCKKTNGGSDTCNYTIRIQRNDINVEGIDVEIGAVELKNGSSDDRGVIKVASTAAVGDLALIVSDPVVAAGTSIPTTPTGGSKVVAVSGTAEALGASLATKYVYVRAKFTNTGNLYVGDSLVDAVTNQQLTLAAGDSVTIPISNRSSIYLDVDINGEGADYLCLS